MTDSIRRKDIFMVGGEEPCNTHGGQDGLFVVQHQIALWCVAQTASFRNICQTNESGENGQISRFV
jgi:hypothetical protein